MNQVHAMYDITQDDLRYVLCTFVAVSIRWLDDHGWRPLTEAEKVASAHYYRELGRHMGIRDIPETWQDFVRAMDDYEALHFGYDPRSRGVAEVTLHLMATFPPLHHGPRRAVIRSSRADGRRAPGRVPLLPPDRVRTSGRARRAACRGASLRRQPPRLQPLDARHLPNIRSYPEGYDVATIGTFSPTCPVDHRRRTTT